MSLARTYFLSILFKASLGFNFDAKNVQRIQISGGDGAYFGYSLLLQANEHDASVFVGAPKSNTDSHPGIEKPGAVFECDLSTSSCRQYVVDVEGNVRNQRIDGQLFGNAIDGSGTLGGAIVICAQKRQLTSLHQHYFPNGACYEIKNSSDPGNYVKMAPLSDTTRQIRQTHNKVYYFYAFGEAGFSVRYAEDGSHLLLGAPGYSSAEGTVITYHKGRSYDQPEIPHEMFFSGDEYQYFGYSIHSGRFSKHFPEYWYIVGAPRAKDLSGQVILYGDKPLLVKKILTGEQQGSYFGASVLGVDTNNDYGDDLLIGAPTYSTKFYDEGCVYYYKNDGFGSFEEPVRIFGGVTGGRFGTTVAHIGDINRDFFGDVAIAAPYEGTGVVYIYLGSKEGLKSEWSQKIEPEHFNIPNLGRVKGFGFSVSKGVDVDLNGHADVAIGAYITGEVFVVKSSPIVTYFAFLQSNVTELLVNDRKQFAVGFCLWIESTTEEVTEILTVYNIFVDSRGTTDFTGPKVGSVKKSRFCETVTVTLTKNVYGNTNPLIITLTYKQQLENSTDFCRNCPVVDLFASNKSEIQIPFAHDCGADEICDTDLKVEAQFEDFSTLILGKQANVNLQVTVENRGEPAYVCKLSMTLPPDVDLIQLPSTCVISDQVLSCLVENNLVQGDSRTLVFNLDVEHVTTKTSAITVSMNVTSVGRDISPEDNAVVVTLPVELDIKPQLTWKSAPEHALYAYDSENLMQRLSFEHQFSLSNLGVSPLGVNVDILIPTVVDDEQVLSIYTPKATVNNRPSIICTLEGGNDVFLSENLLEENQTIEIDARNYDVPTFADEDAFKNATPNERTLYISCTDRRVKCAKIKCSGDEVSHSNLFANIGVKVLMDVQKIGRLFKNDLKTKDIIVFVSSAYTDIHNSSTGCNAFTILHGNLSSKGVSIWVIIFSVVGGLLIVTGIVYAMYKCNFFRREYKERLINEYDDGAVTMRDLSEPDEDFQ